MASVKFVEMSPALIVEAVGLNVCPQCSHHMALPARARLDALLTESGL